MKSEAKSRIVILIILGVSFSFSSFFISLTNLGEKDNYSHPECCDEMNFERENPKISSVSGKIHIDNNWSAAKAAGICTGSGTYSDPYVIKNLEIDGEGLGNCIIIENSDVFFRIEGCILFNSGSMWSDAGIALYNVNNSQLINNDCIDNANGIFLNMFCVNNFIRGNEITDNSQVGICVINYCENNTILGNVIKNCPSLAMELEFSSNNKILENEVNNNVNGIWVLDSDNVTISDNIINTISYNGIYSQTCRNITISRNIINNINYRGINLDHTDGSQIFYNCFINNIVNAFDEGTYNQWDNGTKGNYWDDYTGVDENGDGIGDTPYYYGMIQDNFPLMECPIPPKETDEIPFALIIIILSISGGALIILTLLWLNRSRWKRKE